MNMEFNGVIEGMSLKISFWFRVKQAAKRKKMEYQNMSKICVMVWEKATNMSGYGEFLLYTLTRVEFFYFVSDWDFSSLLKNLQVAYCTQGNSPTPQFKNHI